MQSVSYLVLIPLLPLIGAIINGGGLAMAAAQLPGGPNRKLVSMIAVAMPALACVLTIAASQHLADLNDIGETIAGVVPGQLQSVSALQQQLWTWFDIGSIPIQFGLYFDQLTSLMLLFITGIGTLITLYSVGYMANDRGFARFMAYLNLFLFSMTTLVLGDSLVVTFLGWEGVGLCSYLLIGFWHKKDENNAAANKAFIVNRVGDLGVLLGTFALLAVVMQLGGTGFSYHELEHTLHAHPEAGSLYGWLIGLAAFAIFFGCTAKSAQIPLFTWLPDAMAGPTPVSALIHAATMVTSGIYLCARLNFVFVMSPGTMYLITIVAGATALWAAITALKQWDIKKVLAYSTVSQLGFMFMAVGVGAFDVALYHVVTHAFFKATLFLGAGSVIHAMHHATKPRDGVDFDDLTRDMRIMGGLRRSMPSTYVAMFFAWWAIIGLPLGSGFMSKDLILERLAFAGTGVGYFVYVLGVLTALLTALT